MRSSLFKILFRLALAVLLLAETGSALVTSFSRGSSQVVSSKTRLGASTPFGVDDTSDARHGAIRSALVKLQEAQAVAGPFVQKLDKAIEVKPSLIPGAGQALFAKANIKSGSIISFYPIHGMGVDFTESSICMALDESDQAHFDQEEKDANYLQYIIGSRPLLSHNVAEMFSGDSLFIDVNPDREDKVGWLSHYVNDGATVTKVGEDGVLDYYERSTQAKNCVHVPFGPCPILATVATRKIKKGEELLTTYGASYWLNVVAPDSELDLTLPIQEAAMKTAKDLFAGMQSVEVTYQTEAAKMDKCFSS